MSSNSEKAGNQEELTKQLLNQLQIARSEISNLRQQLKAATGTNQKEYTELQQKLELWRCLGCHANQTQQLDEAASLPNVDRLNFNYIGLISTHFPEKRGTPRQSAVCSNVIAKLTLNNHVFTNPEHAIEGLQQYSHMWILYHFHKNNVTHVRAKVSPPRLNGIKTGVFATRSPHRPCPIGLSLVKIERIVENTIYFSGVDMVDQTPVLDIKPYIPQYDSPECLNMQPQVVNVDSLESHDFDSQFIVPVTLNDDLNTSYDSTDVRVMDGEENNERSSLFVDQNRRSENTQLREAARYPSMPDSRMGEREAPDGEEEETPVQAASSVNEPGIELASGDVHIPAWIGNPPVSTLTVLFKDRALEQLQQLGSEGEEKKNIITNVLREDPRSVYLRGRWGSHCYVFRIAELFVSCKFNQTAHSVTVYQVFQNAVPDLNE